MLRNLKDVLLALHGSSQVTVDTQIDVTPKCIQHSRKTGLSLHETFQGHTSITQLSRRYGTCGLTYEKTINNRLDKDGNDNHFQVESRSWGERVGKSFIIEHKEQSYLELFYENMNSAHTKHLYKFEDGSILTPAQVQSLETEFLPIKHGSKKQEATGISKQVAVNNIKLQNVIRFSGYGLTLGDHIKELDAI
jgi:hypothetical protein